MKKIKFITKQDLDEHTVDEIKAALLRNEYSIEVQNGTLFIELDNKGDKKSVVKAKKPLYESELKEFATTKDLPVTKNRYVKKEDRNDPTKSHRTEFNRSGKKVNVRVDPELIEQMKEAAKESDVPQTQWLSEAIQAKLDLDE